MTKKEVLEAFGTTVALAKYLGISHAAVSQWREIPELRKYQIKESAQYKRYMRRKRSKKTS